MPSRALLLWLLLHWQWISAKCQSAESSTEQKAEHERERECPANSQGRSTFLWSLNVSWRTAPAFLFGTIHVPYDRVWRHVSSSAKRAFQRADSVVFELALQKPETVERLIQCKQLPDERGSLRDHLPAQLFGRLAAYMKRLKQKLLHKGFQQGHRSRAQVRRQMSRLFPSNWEQRKPVWLLFLLFQLSDSPPSTEQYAEAPMLDLFMAKLALDQGKALLSLETAAEQCSPLQSVRQEQVLFAINYTLGYLEWAEARAAAGKTEPRLQKAPVDQLISHYSCGTMGTGLEQLVFGAHRFAQTGFSVSPEQYQLARKVDNLLVEDVLLRRNERMARRADLLLHQHPDRTFFFALGAGHFLGQDSLIGQLRRFGYWVTPIDDDQQERASSSSQAMEPLFSQPVPRMGIQLREFAAKSNSPAALVQSTLAFAVAALWPSLAFHWHWLT